MSLKKETSGRRSIQVEVEVPGTPDEVWRAIATGPGISSWFVPTRVDERQGGETVANFGPGMDSVATVTAWDAPKRFATEGEIFGPGAKVATEWTIEARAGGTCVVRVVHSLFAETDDWDNQLKGVEEGWPPIFRILRRYLETFRNMPCSMMQLVSMAAESDAKTWEKLGGELGLLNVAAGQTWNAPAGFPRVTGAVDALGKGTHSHTVLLRLDAPVPGTAYIGAFPCGGAMAQVYLAFYFYGDKAKAVVERDQEKWQRWIDERFPMPQMG